MEIVVKNGKCRLVGFVDLGKIHDNMEKLAGNQGVTVTYRNKLKHLLIIIKYHSWYMCEVHEVL